MGCYTSKPKFSTLVSKKDMLDMLAQERAKFKKEVTEMDKRKNEALSETVNATNEIDSIQSKEKLEKINKEKPLREALTTFTKGLEEIELNLKEKEVSDVQGLGKVLDTYFGLVDERLPNEERVKNEIEAVKKWIYDNVKS